MRTLKLYGSGASTANAVASVIIPSATRIKGVQVQAFIDCVTDNGACQLEISQASASEIAINGSQQCIVTIGMFSNFLTSGLAQFGVNQFFPVDVAVAQGQILYLHALVSGTLTYTFTGLLWYA